MSFSLSDPCGIPFQNGVNMAYSNFGQDLGGVAEWSVLPLHQDAAAQSVWKNAFTDMVQNGCITVVRIWMLAELWTSDIQWNGNCPTGTNGNINLDICKLLEIADSCGIQIQPTLISFDGFKRRGNAACTNDLINDINDVPSTYVSVYDVWNDGCWSDFCTHVIGPMVAAAENCAFSSALHSWDVMNEPDQVTNANISYQNYTYNAGPGVLTAGQEFDPQNSNCYYSLDIVQMRALLTELINCTRANSSCPITVGVNLKWMSAYSDLGLDFLSPHTYVWAESSTDPSANYFPTFTTEASSLTNTGLPISMGEYPPADPNDPDPLVAGQAIAPHADLLQGYCDNNYIAVFPWSYKDRAYGYSDATIAEQNTFADAEVKTLKNIIVDPVNVECGTTQTVTIKSQSGCGDHIDASNLSVSSGSLSNISYNTANCCYTATYTAPACPTSTTATFSAVDATGRVGTGTVAVGSNVATCTTATATVLVTPGDVSCIPVPFSFECGSCDCENANWTLISGDDSCPKIGDIYVYALSGCDCVDCGPPSAYFKNGYQPPACLVYNDPNFGGQDTITVGPIKSKERWRLQPACTPLPDCPECP